MDKPIQKQIKKFILKLQKLKDPRSYGKGLVGNLSGLWRYRVGDYRSLCQIRGKELYVLVVDIRHRREVYNR